MHKVVYLLLLIAFLFMFTGCEERTAKVEPNGKIIKIALIAPMSGPEKKSGDNTLLGIQAALQIQQFLDNGTKIEFIIEDNKGALEQTKSVLKKLHDQVDVAAVMLLAKSDIVLGLIQDTEAYRIPILALNATHPDITKNNSYITQFGFDDTHQGKVAALYVRDEILIDRVAVIRDPDNSHYSFLASAFIKEFADAGGNVVEHLLDVTSTSDLRTILDQLSKTDVQLLYLAVPPKQVIQIARKAKELNWNPRMMGSDGLMTHILLQFEDDKYLAEGMMATDFYSSTMPKTEYARKATRILNKLSSSPSTTYIGLGCEGTSLLINVLNRCGVTTERSCVNSMLRNTNGFKGLFGKITIRSDGKTERPVFVNEVKNQRLHFLIKVY